MLIGIAVAAPVGPVNVICLQRTLLAGPRQGVTVALGAAVGDAIFGALAAFGLTTLHAVLMAQNDTFKLAGGAIMAAFAWKIWHTTPHFVDRAVDHSPPVRAALATFALTVSNPITILGFVSIFAAAGFADLGLEHQAAMINAGTLVAGVFLGSLMWWVTLCFGASLVRERVSDRLLRGINRGAAVLVAGFAVAAFASVWL